MKFDLVTLYPMHRRCITLISSLLTPTGWVRKPLNYLKVRTGMYRYILLRTNMEFSYCPVTSRTGTYWYLPVRTYCPILSRGTGFQMYALVQQHERRWCCGRLLPVKPFDPRWQWIWPPMTIISCTTRYDNTYFSRYTLLAHPAMSVSTMQC